LQKSADDFAANSYLLLAISLVLQISEQIQIFLIKSRNKPKIKD
jgi:hypothetical protein